LSDLSIGISDVLVKVGDLVVDAAVGTPGFSDNGGAFYHTSSDCSGTRYALANPPYLAIRGLQDGKHVFYAAPPYQNLTFLSYELYSPTFAAPMVCTQWVAQPFSAGVLTSVDLSTLGLVPPFHFEF
jgi:hypothetical protein